MENPTHSVRDTNLVVQSSLLMVGFQQQNLPLITFLCRSLTYLHQLLP